MLNEQPQRDQMEKRKKQWEAIWWAGAFLWAGLILLLDSADALPQIGGADAWSWIFAGAGLLALVGNIWRIVSTNEPNPTAWDFTWGGILLIVGFAGFFSVEIALPLILLLVGGVLLVRVVLGRDQAD